MAQGTTDIRKCNWWLSNNNSNNYCVDRKLYKTLDCSDDVRLDTSRWWKRIDVTEYRFLFPNRDI